MKSLTEVRAAMLAKLKTSLLSPAHAKQLQLEPHLEGGEFRLAGFKLPYFHLDGKIDHSFYRYRFLQTTPSTGWGSAAAPPEKPLRYIQPKDTDCHVYLPPLFSDGSWRAISEDPTVDLIITEGELKAACLCSLGKPTIGLGGVQNWRSRKLEQELIPALEQFVWEGRTVVIAFDNDVHTNVNVFRARSQLITTLTRRGARVLLLELPMVDGQKMGIDDYLFQQGGKGKDELDKLLAKHLKADEYNRALHEMNRAVAYVAKNDMVVVLNDDELGHEAGMLKNVRTFKDSAYANLSYTEYPPQPAKPKRCKTAETWLNWEYRGTVRSLVYAPGQPPLTVTPDGNFNIWRGWGCQPKSGGTAQPWEDLLGLLTSEARPSDVQWLRRWFAYPLQHPGTKMLSAVVMWGRVQGTGKSMLGETMRHIYGASNFAKIENKDLSGRQFNKWMEGRQFLLGDEISMEDKRTVSGVVKSLITSTSVVIEPKGAERYEIDDFANYYFTSNHVDAFVLEDTDRRFFVNEVVAGAVSNTFYEKYQKWLSSGGAAHLFNYLLELDLGDFNPKAAPPITDSKLKMLNATRSDVASWVAAVKTNPEDYCAGPGWATSEHLRKLYDPQDKAARITANVLTRLMHDAGFRDLNPHGNIAVDGKRGLRVWHLFGQRPSSTQVQEYYTDLMESPPFIGGKANPKYKKRRTQ